VAQNTRDSCGSSANHNTCSDSHHLAEPREEKVVKDILAAKNPFLLAYAFNSHGMFQ
jgi:hypothetical protein